VLTLRRQASEAETVAEQSDVVILCVGLDATLRAKKEIPEMSFHQATREISDFGAQRILVNKIMEKGKPVIIVNASGSAINVELTVMHLSKHGIRDSTEARLLQIYFSARFPLRKAPVTVYEDAAKLPDFSITAWKTDLSLCKG
jgi:beta-glucosidase